MTSTSIDDVGDGTPACIGVLLSNLGTPDAPTAPALRNYLAEFLSDPRVIELPRVLWLPVLHGVILRTRPRKSAHAYREVWTADGSPLLSISRRQAAALQARLQSHCRATVRVALGMRYGKPSLGTALDELRGAGARHVLLLPLYPQYSATTTASTFDALASVLRRWRALPELRTVMSYHNDRGYILALKKSVEAHWSVNGRADKLLFSFHGIPLHYAEAGDPYHGQCLTTARLVAEALGLDKGDWQVSFQSRVGPRAWLQPYTDVMLAQLPNQGVKTLDVICPGFSADCLETLEEIAMRGRDTFLHAGGERFRYIPALNDSEEHVAALTSLVLRHTRGWPGNEPAE